MKAKAVRVSLGLMAFMGVGFSTVYVVPPEIESYMRKTDTSYDFVFKKLCSNTNGRLNCRNLPTSVASASTPLSEIGNTSVEVSLRIMGNDSVVLCSDYRNPSSCQTFWLENYADIRFETIPYNQIGSYRINKPKCTTGRPTIVLPFFSKCARGVQFYDNRTHWRLNSGCVPTNSNITVAVFCSTWSH